MNKPTERTLRFAMVTLVLLVVAGMIFTRGRWSGEISCDDGKRKTIDMNDFVTRYTAYSVEFNAAMEAKAKFEGRISPVQLQQMSESLQSANEFRKILVAGYNACAVSRANFNKYASRFQVLDSLSRQIDDLAKSKELDSAGQTRLKALVDEYIAVSQKLSSD